VLRAFSRILNAGAGYVAYGECVMSIPHDQGTERSDPEALLPMLWLGAGLVAIVAFTYWLNAI
jgi:hypothetical protein